MLPTVNECRILFSDIVYMLVLILKTGKSFVLLNIPIIHTQQHWLNQWFEFGGETNNFANQWQTDRIFWKLWFGDANSVEMTQFDTVQLMLLVFCLYI